MGSRLELSLTCSSSRRSRNVDAEDVSRHLRGRGVGMQRRAATLLHPPHQEYMWTYLTSEHTKQPQKQMNSALTVQPAESLRGMHTCIDGDGAGGGVGGGGDDGGGGGASSVGTRLQATRRKTPQGRVPRAHVRRSGLLKVRGGRPVGWVWRAHHSLRLLSSRSSRIPER